MQQANKVESVPSNFSIHSFSSDIGGIRYLYQVLKMKESLLIFINHKNDMVLNDLSVAMQGRHGNGPFGTRIMGNFIEEQSKDLALRVAKKSGKTVYVSCNVAMDKRMVPLVERQLFHEMRTRPEVF